MEINFRIMLKDLDEQQIKRGGTAEDLDRDKFIDLAYVCEMALLANTEKTNKLSGEKKCHRAVLAHEIHRKGTLDVIAEDVVMLKESIADSFTPLIVMRAYEILDPKPKLAAVDSPSVE